MLGPTAQGAGRVKVYLSTDDPQPDPTQAPYERVGSIHRPSDDQSEQAWIASERVTWDQDDDSGDDDLEAPEKKGSRVIVAVSYRRPDYAAVAVAVAHLNGVHPPSE
jgi:hypothetical protein